MVEPILSGIVLGMITVSAMGLFVAAFLQYRRRVSALSPASIWRGAGSCTSPG